MYFNEKEDTNIDSEFEGNKKFNLDFKKLKPILFIVGALLLLIIIICIVITIVSNSGNDTIELLGDEKITINLGEDYVEPGYKAYDKKKNDITSEVKITSNLDTSKEGSYEIVYSIDGVNKVRYISVVKNDNTYIYLKGEQNMHLKVGQNYSEPGYIVYDSVDSDLTSKVTISGTVNTSKKGTYQLTYTVTNSRNVTVSVKRTIVVD